MFVTNVSTASLMLASIALCMLRGVTLFDGRRVTIAEGRETLEGERFPFPFPLRA